MTLGEREIIIIGTAHISKESAELVRRVIETQGADGVCIELDEQRYRALAEPQHFEGLDLREVLRNRQLATLALQLVLSAYQRALGLKLGVRPGAEFLEAANAATACGIPLHLCDRDVHVTLRRAAQALGFWKKLLLFSTLIASLFERPKLDEDALRQLRQSDVLSNLLSELGRTFPGIKRVLIDERDTFLAEQIRRAPGARLIAVVGAGHVPGLVEKLQSAEAPPELEALLETPPPSPRLRLFGWAIPALIIAGLVAIGLRQGLDVAGQNLLFWILANGVPAALGTALALGHPLTVIAAFAAAPLTSLTPVIGVGYVTGFLQAWLVPPRVREFRSAPEDLRRLSGLWRNRLLRLLLVFVLSTLGSLLGTALGGATIWGNALAG